MDYVLEDLLGTYWGLAYEEGSTNVSNGTRANEVLHKIREAWNRRASPASVPEDRKDAERYRWLKNNDVMAYMIFQRSSGTFIDSEIDQAMQEDKP